ncbi:unnamed protein product [Rhizophagus irregularis]|nr:unnamed protein product [Rhizophagus irregularis]
MYTFVNFFSQSFYPTNSTLTPPPSPTTASTLQHECKISESDANQESLFDQVGNRIPKNRLKRFNLPKLTVEWKCKKSREDAKKNRTSAGYISLRFCAQQI